VGSALSTALQRRQRVGSTLGGSWERRQLRRLPWLTLIVSWALAHIIGASLAASCFMWLLFAGAVLVVLTVTVERFIHLLQVWDERKERHAG